MLVGVVSAHELVNLPPHVSLTKPLCCYLTSMLVGVVSAHELVNLPPHVSLEEAEYEVLNLLALPVQKYTY